MKPLILITDDDPLQRYAIKRLILKHMDYGVREAKSGMECLEILADDEASHIKLVVLDLNMPGLSGFETLEKIKGLHPNCVVIIMTGSDDVQTAVYALKLGAYDFISKDEDPQRIVQILQNSAKHSDLERRLQSFEVERGQGCNFARLIGHDMGLAEVVQIGKKAAECDMPLLLLGETGVGKDIFAQSVHAESKRSSMPFIAVNCAALPEQLVESILFGHEKGAFTGALQSTIGKFRQAEGGTIFLDEISELPLHLQSKILRVLQQGEIEPVGRAETLSVNVRVIAAANRNLADEVRAGRFREDLYYRLNVLEVKIPPLRERTQDIEALCMYFLKLFTQRENIPYKPIVSPVLMELKSYAWPGNVRELENALYRAMALSSGNVLDFVDFPFLSAITQAEREALTFRKGKSVDVTALDGSVKPWAEIEHDILKIALAMHNGNVTATAEALGIAKTTIYRKFDRMNASLH